MDLELFEKRKKDHIRLALDSENQAVGLSGLDALHFEHEALPDLNISDIDITSKQFQQKLKTPFYINSMTAGHSDGIELNCLMARLAQDRGWMMGVGSQRRQLNDKVALNEWKKVRKVAPKAVLIGNIGIAQLITSKIEDIQRLVESIEAQGLFIHLNILQECIQPEGTPQFKGGLQAIEKLCRKSKVPILIKETGCGISLKTLKRLKNIGITVVDVSGLGGTHWGRIEGHRAGLETVQNASAKTFQNWGITTVQSLVNGIKLKPDYDLWASGGVRTGLDAAKLLALGAQAVGYAKPAMEQALQGETALSRWMETMEFELRVAMLCTGSLQTKHLKNALTV